MNFVALDVETANADMASICQVGLAIFEGGVLTTEWTTLVDPGGPFDAVNVSIHGISAAHVRGAPMFPEVFASLCDHVGDRVVVAHSHFDRVAVGKGLARHGHPAPGWRWLDSSCVARRAWPGRPSGGYRLNSLCALIGHDFRHHDALEDAKAAARVVLAAAAESGLDIDGWLARVRQPIKLPAARKPARTSGQTPR